MMVVSLTWCPFWRLPDGARRRARASASAVMAPGRFMFRWLVFPAGDPAGDTHDYQENTSLLVVPLPFAHRDSATTRNN